MLVDPILHIIDKERRLTFGNRKVPQARWSRPPGGDGLLAVRVGEAKHPGYQEFRLINGNLCLTDDSQELTKVNGLGWDPYQPGTQGSGLLCINGEEQKVGIPEDGWT
eukprot:gene15412-14911_t